MFISSGSARNTTCTRQTTRTAPHRLRPAPPWAAATLAAPPPPSTLPVPQSAPGIAQLLHTHVSACVSGWLASTTSGVAKGQVGC